MDLRPVVVGVDGSAPSIAAAEHAAAVAVARDLPLLLIHGYLHPFGYGTAPLGPYESVPPPPPEDAEEMLNDLAAVLRTTHPGLDITHRQVLGGGGASLVAESDDAPLVVVGSRGRGGFTGLLLGSVSTQVVAHAHCPVLVVRPDSPAAPQPDAPVIVGVDGSAGGLLALEEAAAEAVRQRRHLVLVHAGAPADDTATREVAQLLAEAAEHARTDHPDLAVQTRALHETDPAAALIEMSRDAAVVVVGSRGRGGFTGLLLGSVSQALTHHAHCPVLVVPLRTGRTASTEAAPRP